MDNIFEKTIYMTAWWVRSFAKHFLNFLIGKSQTQIFLPKFQLESYSLEESSDGVLLRTSYATYSEISYKIKIKFIECDFPINNKDEQFDSLLAKIKECLSEMYKEHYNMLYGMHSSSIDESALKLEKYIKGDTEMLIKFDRSCSGTPAKKKTPEQQMKDLIKSITINETKKIVTVVFNDNDVQMSKCSEDDAFDPVVGVALCIAAHIGTSKTQFKKFVHKTAKYTRSNVNVGAGVQEPQKTEKLVEKIVKTRKKSK